MPTEMSHPKFGSRTVADEKVTAYERTGWKAGAEVVPEPVDGSIKDILAAVGEDSDKARVALSAEQDRPNPRTSLVTALARIAEPTENQES